MLIILRNGAVTLVLLAVIDQSSGFVNTRHRHCRSSSENRQSHEAGWNSGTPRTPTVEHLSLSRESSFSFESLAARPDQARMVEKPAKRSNRGDQDEAAVWPRPGMATQLGGWSYARTVLSNLGKSKDGEGDGSDEGSTSSGAAAASGAAQSQSGGSSAGESLDSALSKDAKGGSTGRQGVRQGGGGDDDDDDDDDDETDNDGKGVGNDGPDSWDLSEFGDSQDGLGIGFSEEGDDDDKCTEEEEEQEEEGEAVAVGGDVVQGTGGQEAGVTSPSQEYEIVCDGDVCERKPVGSKPAQTVPLSNGAPAGAGAGAAAAAAAATPAAGAAAGSQEQDDGAQESGGEDVDDPDVAQLVSMGWEAEESAAALEKAGGDVLGAAEALAAQEEDDLERYKEGLTDLQQRGWDSDVAMSAMREAGGNSTAALHALQEEDRVLSMQFEQSIKEMVEHGWDEEVARKALLMQWQKDIEGRRGSRKDQKQFEKTVQGVHAKAVKEGKLDPSRSSSASKKKEPSPVPANREDVVFEVTDKTLQKVVMESPVPVILDVYAEWCGPCKQLTPALEEAAIRSGGMFRVAKVDAEKQKGIAEVLGIRAFPSVFGVKDGIILDNFVGGLSQDEMQSFMMGVVMGVPPPKDKELREHQKSQSELRGISRKLAHVAGLAVLGSRKKESLCLKVDNALSEMLLHDLHDGGGPASENASAVAAAKKAARTVVTVLMSAYKYPEDPKYRSLSTSSKVYVDVLASHPPMLEVLRLAGFRRKDGDESHLALLHRNMAVLASVQDRVEVWNKSIKMPQVENDSEDDGGDLEGEEEDEEERERIKQARDRLSTLAKLEIRDPSGGNEAVVRLEVEADSTLGDLFRSLQETEGFGDDLVLKTAFPKRELAASDPSCHSSTLLSLGLAPSARLIATTATALAAEREAEGDDAEAAAARKEGLKTKMMDRSRDGNRKGEKKKAGTLFGTEDGIIKAKEGKHREYFGGDSTVTLAAEDSTEEDSTEDEGHGGDQEIYSQEDDFDRSGGGQIQSGDQSDGEVSSLASEREEEEEEEESAVVGGMRGNDREEAVLPESEEGSEFSDEDFSEERLSENSSIESGEMGEGFYVAEGSSQAPEGSYDDDDVVGGSSSYDSSNSDEEEEEEIDNGLRSSGREGDMSTYDEDEDSGSFDEDDVDSYDDEGDDDSDSGRGKAGRGTMARRT